MSYVGKLKPLRGRVKIDFLKKSLTASLSSDLRQQTLSALGKTPKIDPFSNKSGVKLY